jgi:hypothetical protein
MTEFRDIKRGEGRPTVEIKEEIAEAVSAFVGTYLTGEYEVESVDLHMRRDVIRDKKAEEESGGWKVWKHGRQVDLRLSILLEEGEY